MSGNLYVDRVPLSDEKVRDFVLDEGEFSFSWLVFYGIIPESNHIPQRCAVLPSPFSTHPLFAW